MSQKLGIEMTIHNSKKIVVKLSAPSGLFFSFEVDADELDRMGDIFKGNAKTAARR